MPVYQKILVLAKFQYHTHVPLGVCDRHTEMISSSTKNGGLADSETLNIPYSPCFPYICCNKCTHRVRTSQSLSLQAISLKLKCRKYPTIPTHHTLNHCISYCCIHMLAFGVVELFWTNCFTVMTKMLRLYLFTIFCAFSIL